MRKIFTSIDIGTNEIKVVTVEEFNDRFNVLASSSVKSTGVKQGLIVDANLVSSSIKKAIKDNESKLGVKIEETIAIVPSNNMEICMRHGKVNVHDDMITGDVIFDCMENALKEEKVVGMEVANVSPIEFRIDESKKVKNPLGLSGKTLESKNIVCYVPKKNVYSVISIIESLNIKVVDIVISSIGDYYSFKNKELDERVGAIVNIGEDKSVVSIFNKGIIMSENIIPIGSSMIDKELIFNYKIEDSEAIKIKNTFAVASRKYADGEETYEFVNRVGNEVSINQYQLAELVETKLVEMLKSIKNEINNLTKREINYIIVTGGITSMLGFSSLVEELYGRHSSVLSLAVIGIRNNKYSTVYGSIKYFNEKLNLREKDYTMFSEEKINELTQVRRKIGAGSVLGKIFKIFD
mgnify:FL=1